ncbi:MAG: 16S rRNA (adenine(1518)-N(6)/adenine(1519)-N(6))-dimethyltransferase RsmA [Planctomycetales bacterium]
MSLFQQAGLNPRSDLGQNFLIDLNLIDYVVEQAAIGPDDVILEIGTGTGGLTTFMAQSAAGVVSVEIDPRVHRLACEATGAFSNVTLLCTDALANKHHFAPAVLEALNSRLADAPGRHLKLVANLPYCIATPVMSNLVASSLPWTLMVVTIQWELAERLRASPGTNDYSALSVWLQSQCRLQVLKKLGPTVFWPRPQVDSAIVRLEPDPERSELLGNREFFHEFIRRLFEQRRKGLRGVLAGMYRTQLEKPVIDTLLEQQALAGGARAEQLDVPTLVRLAQGVHTLLGDAPHSPPRATARGRRGANAPHRPLEISTDPLQEARATGESPAMETPRRAGMTNAPDPSLQPVDSDTSPLIAGIL